MIPKLAHADSLNDFRPISLISSPYKILAKVFANRLKGVISDLISDNQSGFVAGRQLVDGVLIASEVINYVKRAKVESVLLKLDFEKAYDMVRWDYLDEIFSQMNFGDRWRRWMRSCFHAHLLVLVNGVPTRDFVMANGIR